MEMANTDPLVLLKAVATDRRYLSENLAILDPREGLARVAYRERWLHPSIRSGLQQLPERQVYFVFFDHGTHLLLPVRRGRIEHIERRDGRVRFTIALGEFVQCCTAPPAEALPRLADNEFDPGDQRPPDGLGRHAFVFGAPTIWAQFLSALPPVTTAQAWADLVRALAAPDGSPYRNCHFVLLTSDESLEGQRRIAPGDKNAAVVKVLALGPSEAIDVQLIGYAGTEIFWRESRVLHHGELQTVTIPWPGAAVRANEQGHLRIEAASWTPHPSLSRISVLEIHPPPDSVVARRETGTAASELALEAILAHARPADDSQRDLCRQIVEGIKAHYRLWPGIVDRLMTWEMYSDAAALLLRFPDLAHRGAGYRQLAIWLSTLTRARVSVESLVSLIQAATARLDQSPDTELLDSLLDAFAALDSAAFWRCLDLPKRTADVLDMPLVAASINAPTSPFDRQDRLAHLVLRHHKAVPQRQIRLALELCEKLDSGAAWRLARSLAEEHQPVDWDGLLADSLGAEQMAEVLGMLPASAYRHVAQWYTAHQGDGNEWPAGFHADLLLWLEHSAPADEKPRHIERIAQTGVDDADYWMLTHAKSSRSLSPELRASVERALGELEVDLQWNRIRTALAGKRILVVGGARSHEAAWNERLATDAIAVRLRWQTNVASDSEQKLPEDVDYCVVLRWVGHQHTIIAKRKYGEDRVSFVGRGGYAAFRRRLLHWGSRMIEPKA